MRTKTERTDGTAPAGLDSSLLLLLLERMLLIRQFEGKIAEFARKGIFKGSIHFSTGEEATAVGACSALEAQDYILPTHRGHGQELAKGCDPARLMAEIIGRESGLCKGRGGTLHIFDREHNILGAQAILGAQFPIAVGVGLAIKLKAMPDTTVLCFTGDGTTNEGTFYEGMSAAALWKLPVIFVCVNNVYGMGMKYDETCRTSITEKGIALKLPSVAVDGNDVQVGVSGDEGRRAHREAGGDARSRGAAHLQGRGAFGERSPRLSHPGRSGGVEEARPDRASEGGSPARRGEPRRDRIGGPEGLLRGCRGGEVRAG